MKKYKVFLAQKERRRLEAMSKTGTHKDQKMKLAKNIIVMR